MNLGLFPISQSHKLIQNFLQSLEPPFVVGGCRSISPVHLGAVRLTDLGISSRSFLIRSDTSLGIDTIYSSEGLGGLFSQFRKAVRVTCHIPLYSSPSLKPVGVHPLIGTI